MVLVSAVNFRAFMKPPSDVCERNGTELQPIPKTVLMPQSALQHSSNVSRRLEPSEIVLNSTEPAATTHVHRPAYQNSVASGSNTFSTADIESILPRQFAAHGSPSATRDLRLFWDSLTGQPLPDPIGAFTCVSAPLAERRQAAAAVCPQHGGT